MRTETIQTFTQTLTAATTTLGDALRAANVQPTLGVVVTHTGNERAETLIQAIRVQGYQVGVHIARRDVPSTTDDPGACRAGLLATDALDKAWHATAPHVPAAPDLSDAAQEMAAGIGLTPITRVSLRDFDVHRRDKPWHITPSKLAAAVTTLAVDPTVHGVLCPPPLPEHVDLLDDVARLIPLAKDVGAVRGATSDLVAYSLVTQPGVTLADLVADRQALKAYQWAAIALILHATARAAVLQYNATHPEPLDLTATAPLHDNDPFAMRAFGAKAAPTCGRCLDTGRFSEAHVTGAHCNCKRGRRMQQEWYDEKHSADRLHD